MNNDMNIGMNIDNAYMYAVLKAFQTFLNEDMHGQVFCEVRLSNKLELALKLFPEERAELQRQYRAAQQQR